MSLAVPGKVRNRAAAALQRGAQTEVCATGRSSAAPLQRRQDAGL